MMEKQPQMSLAMQAPRKCSTSGPSSRHMISGLVSIDRPCSEYSGKTTRSMVAMLRRALATSAQMRSVCRARSSLRDDDGILDLHQPDDHAIGRLVESAKSAHRFLRRLIYQRVSKGRASRSSHIPLRPLGGETR